MWRGARRPRYSATDTRSPLQVETAWHQIFTKSEICSKSAKNTGFLLHVILSITQGFQCEVFIQNNSRRQLKMRQKGSPISLHVASVSKVSSQHSHYEAIIVFHTDLAHVTSCFTNPIPADTWHFLDSRNTDVITFTLSPHPDRLLLLVMMSHWCVREGGGGAAGIWSNESAASPSCDPLQHRFAGPAFNIWLIQSAPEGFTTTLTPHLHPKVWEPPVGDK